MSISSPVRVTAQSMEDLGQTEPVSLGTQKTSPENVPERMPEKIPKMIPAKTSGKMPEKNLQKHQKSTIKYLN